MPFRCRANACGQQISTRTGRGLANSNAVGPEWSLAMLPVSCQYEPRGGCFDKAPALARQTGGSQPALRIARRVSKSERPTQTGSMVGDSASGYSTRDVTVARS